MNVPTDIARLIYQGLNDEDLAQACLVNKNFANKICNNTFWIEKIMNKYLLSVDLINKYKGNNTYWAYYYHLSNTIASYTSNGKLKVNDLLMNASEMGRNDLIQIALNNGADIHYRDDNALINASTQGATDTVEFLLEKGANIHAQDDDALIWASINNNVDTVKFLLEKGANIHTQNNLALLYAVEKDMLELAEFLIDKGIPDNNLIVNINSMLATASVHGHIDMVKLLIRKGANIHYNNNLALRTAIKYGYDNIVEILKIEYFNSFK